MKLLTTSTKNAWSSGMLGDISEIRTQRGKDRHHNRCYESQGYRKYRKYQFNRGPGDVWERNPNEVPTFKHCKAPFCSSAPGLNPVGGWWTVRCRIGNNYKQLKSPNVLRKQFVVLESFVLSMLRPWVIWIGLIVIADASLIWRGIRPPNSQLFPRKSLDSFRRLLLPIALFKVQPQLSASKGPRIMKSTWFDPTNADCVYEHFECRLEYSRTCHSLEDCILMFTS